MFAVGQDRKNNGGFGQDPANDEARFLVIQQAVEEATLTAKCVNKYHLGRSSSEDNLASERRVAAGAVEPFQYTLPRLPQKEWPTCYLKQW